eukprot:CAMPEP_0197614402 /NCGR_PEP_ID=MMETSP1326-20131121/59505_1 /TAXON_ID=1155430 /ORGANISM="Genus nov. species nov., Strain RCC2288" /LENGTH=43 /DNA_ID= /DNA_START= /DNA_END= /DNA_ORIENTATION=
MDRANENEVIFEDDEGSGYGVEETHRRAKRQLRDSSGHLARAQ